MMTLPVIWLLPAIAGAMAWDRLGPRFGNLTMALIILPIEFVVGFCSMLWL